MRTRCGWYFIFLLMLSRCTIAAEIWPGLRGVTGNGVATNARVPLEWSDTEGVAWSTPLRGTGNSSPALSATQAFVTAFEKDNQSLWVIAVSRHTGAIDWERKVGEGKLIAYGPPNLYEHRHDPATASPCTDDTGRVYAFFGTGHLVCFDTSGNEVWRRHLAKEFGPYDLKFGMGSSPRIWGDLLILACLHKGPSYVVALDKHTGKEVWLAERNYPALGDATDAYSSPVVLEQPGKSPQLIISGCDHVDAYDVQTGRRVWFDGGLVIPNEEYARTITSPAVGDGIVVANSAKDQHCLAIRADGEGNITGTPHEVWKMKGMADCPTPTIHGGIIYSVRDDGVGTAFELATGKELWKQRVGSGRVQSSPLVAAGRVYFVSLDGKATVVREGRDYEVLARNSLPAGDFYACPAVADGKLFLRERSKLYCISGK